MKAIRVREIHAIEMSSRCNLHCVYCLQPRLARPAQDMAALTWQRTLAWVRHFVAAGTQGDLVLNGTGESTLHPAFVTMVQEARKAIGPERELSVATNGVAVTEAMVNAVAPSRLMFWVSLHRPEKAERAVHYLRRAGLLKNVTCDPVADPTSWAGQVDWPQTVLDRHPLQSCTWLDDAGVMVAADGDLLACCYSNGQADTVVGDVAEVPGDLWTHGHGLCEACWQRVP
jgi:hypothetical protein